MTGESRSTGSAERTGVREHVRPSQTHAEEVVANAPGENFPVALRMLPARHRRHLTNLYFFARLTDDLGDEARDPDADVTELRLGLLDELHLLVHPIAVRKGMRLFHEGTPIPLTLIKSETFKTGVLNLVYASAQSTDDDATYEDAKVHLPQRDR